MMTIDFHAHFLPDYWSQHLPGLLASTLDTARRSTRYSIKPLFRSLQEVQPWVRHLPSPVRTGFDYLTGAATLPRLVVESTPSDLLQAMDEAQIARAVVLAKPSRPRGPGLPLIPNEFVLETCAAQPGRRWIPAVSPIAGVEPGPTLRDWRSRGAAALAVYPDQDGGDIDSRAWVAEASDLQMPILLNPSRRNARGGGDIERFAPWFAEFGKAQFVLAQMNGHEPSVALDLAERHPQVFVDTSGQPAEVIGEAVRRLGASKVLFATGWPFAAANPTLAVERVRKCVSAGTLGSTDAELVLGGNALRLLGAV